VFETGWRKAALAVIGIGALVIALWRIRTARSHSVLPSYYGHALRALSRRGLTRAPAHGARDFARASSEALPAQAAAAFSRLTESYLVERFGGRPPADPRVDLRDLRQALRHSNAVSRSRADAHPSPQRTETRERSAAGPS